MRIIIILAFVVLLSSLAPAALSSHGDLLVTPSIATRSPSAFWTVAIYISADNTLSDNVQDDMDEITQAGIADNVRVVALVDQSSVGDSRLLTFSNGAWNTRQLTVVNASWGNELSMGAPSTLRDFVSWAFSEYPSEHTALDLWGHGAGWSGVCMDRGDWLTLPELSGALAGQNLDLISIDACQMGMVEVAYQLRDCADVLVASEKDVPAEGWQYGDWLSGMAGAGNATAAGTVLAQMYMAWALNHSAYSATVAVIDLGRIGSLAGPLDSFSHELIASWPLLRADITNARITTEKYDGDAEYDLTHFARNIAMRGGSPRLARDANVAEEFVAWTVLYRDAWTRLGDEPAENANGLSIWFPSNGVHPSYRALYFAADTQWDDFLDAYSNISSPPAHAIHLDAVAVDSNSDGAADAIDATLETDAAGSAIFVFESEEQYVSIDADLVAGHASATLKFAGAGLYEVWAYVYDTAGALAALTSIHGRITVESWLYVTGTVTDGAGELVDGALVEIGWGGGWRLNATTGADGAYSVRILCPTQFVNGTLTAIVEGDSVSAEASGPGMVRLDLVVEGDTESFSWMPLIGLIAVGIYCATLAIMWNRRE